MANIRENKDTCAIAAAKLLAIIPIHLYIIRRNPRNFGWISRAV